MPGVSDHSGSRHPGFDARGIWAVAGAWGAALALGQASPVLAGWAAAAGVCLLGVLGWALARNRGIVAWSHHLWGPALAVMAGGTLVASTVALIDPMTGREELAEHVDGGSAVRVEIELTGDALSRWREDPWSRGTDESDRVGRAPRATWDTDGAPDEAADVEGGRWKISGPAEVQRFWSRGRWHEADVPVYLSLPGEGHGSARPGPQRAQTRVYGFAVLKAAEEGMNHAYWAAMDDGETIVDPRRDGLVHQLRDRFVERSSHLPEYGSALLPGMVMGDRSGQSEELDEAMKVTGLAHLTAVSGANCAFIFGTVLWVMRLARCPRWAAFAGATASLAGFVVLVGFEASVIRAAVMGAIAAVAVFVGRGRQAFAALCACSVVLLGLMPAFSRDPAFQLSVLATAGIVVMGRPMAARLAAVMPLWLAQGVAISLAAQLFCQPVLVALQPRLATYGVLANLVVAPLVPFITVLGTAGLVTSTLPSVFASPLVFLSGWAAHLVGLLGTTIGSWPGASVPWPEGGVGSGLAVGLVLCAALALWAVARQARRPARVRRGPDTAGRVPPWTAATGAVSAAAAMIAAVLAPATPLLEPRMQDWNVVACDVGQGDGFLIRTGESAAVAIDVGDEPEAFLSCLDRVGVEQLEAVFVSHLHADHVGGLTDVASRYPVREVYYSTAQPYMGPGEGHPERLLGLSGTGSSAPPLIRRLVAGDHGDFGHGQHSLSWRALWPDADRIPGGENDASLVLDLIVSEAGAEARMLATGDIEDEAMKALLRAHPDLRADVLKVSHHGASNGGTETLELARPKIGLVSVGRENTYGHPSPRIVDAYRDAGVPLLRTDEQGTLLLDLQGGSGAARLAVRVLDPRRGTRRDRIEDRRHRGGIHVRSAPTSRFPARRG
ncbi:ComEC/Rec2 family competence protein [Zhihengliuella halotolerans]|uniref:Competence protein ComEC n=1 Tax=Zhihengliuella halotolerans TaxID=370736 RepID=A0A4Q8ACM0_9MICC|nr:ComEC/Rec2 family competence protein [Zhihengliuella halotolerans]RZU61353.1 competence protein ComEC [Zhihengliuella halotolerans]